MGAGGDEPPPAQQQLCDKLMEEFAGLLEQSLVIAIANDFDLGKDFSEARNALLSLADTVVAEEATGFNPSGHVGENETLDGSSIAPTMMTDSSRPETSVSSTSFPATAEPDGCLTSQSQRVANMPEEELASQLRIMFPDVKDVDITFALKKAADDFEKACDELELITYLEVNGIERPKGIDGFCIGDDEYYTHHKKRGSVSDESKNGRTRLQVEYSLAPRKDDDINGVAEPTRAAKVAKRLGMAIPAPAVTQMASPRPTPATSAQSSRSATPSTASARSDGTSSGWKTVEKKKQQQQQQRNNALYEKQANACDIRMSSHESFGKVVEYSRRGRSDPYFRQAASVYKETGQQQARQARAAEREIWDELVARKSTATETDLHGVPVAEGTRIALARTQAWWDALPGENRARCARQSHFTIITGKGTHSAGGVSQLRQQVGAALDRNGWRYDIGTGVFHVTGKR